uniref:Uncharacterized protein n=1 Tax=Brassica oleracea var. oleracea TaxID=109376 RepID=A0A0D3AQ08_BRAOL
ERSRQELQGEEKRLHGPLRAEGTCVLLATPRAMILTRQSPSSIFIVISSQSALSRFDVSIDDLSRSDRRTCGPENILTLHHLVLQKLSACRGYSGKT